MNKDNIIEIEHINVSYNDLPVLEDVSLTVLRGSFLAVVGPNGAGKTTLIKTILGLVKQKSGTIKVFGKEPVELGEQRKKIGYVPQVLSLDMNYPVKSGDVVLMGRYGRIGLMRRPEKSDRDAVRKAMEKVRILELADTPIARLSGGQWQRVILARALANEPELLILDEPTTGVDAAVTESVYEMLRRFRDEGITIIIVSHDIGVISAYIDVIACLNKRLIVHGRPDEVISDKNLEQMYGCDAMLFFHHKMPHMAVRKH
ncbi:metal ABC transporter ATP-binding protein [candidate division KSB1 bacterium]